MDRAAGDGLAGSALRVVDTLGGDVCGVISAADWVFELCYAGWVCLWVAAGVCYFCSLCHFPSCGTVLIGRHSFAIAATATILGSTTSFLLSRHLLSTFVQRLIAHDRRFAALALTLKHDGLKLLIMIRLCPLPYSLSNGALSTFPTVHWANFALATTIATPRLLIGVFIGSRLAKIAEGVGAEMDTMSRFWNWVGILVSMVFGVVTAWYVYRQTKRRADELELAEGTLNGGGRVLEDEVDFGSDVSEDEDVGKNGGPVNGNGQANGNGLANGNTYRDEPVR